jgi:hypothetical protein
MQSGLLRASLNNPLIGMKVVLYLEACGETACSYDQRVKGDQPVDNQNLRQSCREYVTRKSPYRNEWLIKME